MTPHEERHAAHRQGGQREQFVDDDRSIVQGVVSYRHGRESYMYVTRWRQ